MKKLFNKIQNKMNDLASGITIFSVKSELEREYHQRQAELIANCQYDILNYEGDIAAWDEMIAVYAVKLNLGDESQEVATFDEDKAAELKAIFWDMNSISLRTESRTTTVTRYETNADGELVEVQEDVTMIILTVVADSMSADEISDEYGFSTKQNTIPHKGFHSLRHTFATRAIECGVDVKTLSEILGHKNPTITLNRYAHSLMEHKKDMMNRLGKLYIEA